MLILQKDTGVLRTGGRGCQLRRPTVSCKLPLGSDRVASPDRDPLPMTADAVYPAGIDNTVAFMATLPETPCEALISARARGLRPSTALAWRGTRGGRTLRGARCNLPSSTGG